MNPLRWLMILGAIAATTVGAIAADPTPQLDPGPRPQVLWLGYDRLSGTTPIGVRVALTRAQLSALRELAAAAHEPDSDTVRTSPAQFNLTLDPLTGQVRGNWRMAVASAP